ncbi:MAG: cupin domain-containing protein [Syntrophomonas sp.]|nr:cupin domain-containing protein [Syntrophomonas sp.]
MIKPTKIGLDDYLGHTISPISFIEYQEGSVVSKTLVQQSTGTVTLFAFAKGQGLSEHSAPFDAMVVVLEGKAEIAIAGRSNKVDAGEMIIMPANQPHAVNAIENFKMLLIMIKS